MNNNNEEINDLSSAFDAMEKWKGGDQVTLEKEDPSVAEVALVKPKNEVEKLIDKLPAEERAQFYKIVSQVGLNDDDYLWVLLYIMGYVKVMYEDLPKSINNASDSIASICNDIEPMVKNVVSQEVKKIKREFQEQIARLIDAQSDVSGAFKDGSEKYLESMKVAEAGIDKVILEKKAVIMDSMTTTLKHQVPKIVNQQLENLISEVNKLASKGFVLMLSAVLIGNFLSAIAGKIFSFMFK